MCVVWISAAFLAGVFYPDLYKSFSIYENAGVKTVNKKLGDD